jgi:hypothetical protein
VKLGVWAESLQVCMVPLGVLSVSQGPANGDGKNDGKGKENGSKPITHGGSKPSEMIE